MRRGRTLLLGGSLLAAACAPVASAPAPSPEPWAMDAADTCLIDENGETIGCARVRASISRPTMHVRPSALQKNRVRILLASRSVRTPPQTPSAFDPYPRTPQCFNPHWLVKAGASSLSFR